MQTNTPSPQTSHETISFHGTVKQLFINFKHFQVLNQILLIARFVCTHLLVL